MEVSQDPPSVCPSMDLSQIMNNYTTGKIPKVKGDKETNIFSRT
jgi:hypothetical protein